MNDKLSQYQDNILSRSLQGYTLAMIKVWLEDQYNVLVSQSAISRSIHNSLKSNVLKIRHPEDSEYTYYREKINVGLQHRKYTRHLDFCLGTIEYCRNTEKLTPLQILETLQSQGVETSLNSVYRALRLIGERKKS